MTHYEVLGVGADASTREIRRAYVRRARLAHPDFHADASPRERSAHEAEMRRLNQAWAVLGDPPARRRYDDTLRLGGAGTADPGSPGAAGPGAGTGRGTTASRRPPDPVFVPYDDDDTDYAALLDQAPAGRGVTLPRGLHLVPAGLGLGAVFGLSAGLVTGVGAITGFGLVCLVLCGLTFVLTPALAILRSLDSERD